MSIYSIPPFIAGTLILGLGIFAFSNNKRAIINKVFMLMCFSIFIWLLSYSIAFSMSTKKMGLFWARFSYLGIVFIPITVHHISILFLGLSNIKNKNLIFLSYILGLFFLILSRTRHFFDSVFEYFWGYYPRASYLYFPFLIFFIYFYGRGLLLLSLFLIREKRNKISGTRLYMQNKYVFLALSIAVIASVDYIAKFGFEFYPFGYIFMLCYVAILAYAIVAHQLMNIEVIIKKTLVFTGLFASVFALLVLPTLIIQEFIVSQMATGGRIIGISISAILIVFVLRPLENFLIKITDKFLFQKKYDYKELLRTFTTEVLTVLDLNNLVKLTVANLSDIMKIESCGVLLFDETAEEYKLAASYGIKERNMALSRDNTLATFLNRTRAYLSTAHQGKDSPLPKRIIDDMNKLKLRLAIPLVIHNDMIGILTLGKKKSDEEYTQDDMDILLPLARTLAIAISNAMVLAELGKTQAEAAQREKMAVIGTLSAGINHEICNPLGIARGQCEAFLLNVRDGLYKNKSEAELLEKARTIMQKVIRETDRATAITKRLSSFAKPSKGLYNENVDIRESIDEVLALVGYEMKLDKVGVENKVSKNLPHITGDKKQIEEVFFNLIRNSAQAIHEKGKISIKAHNDEDRIFIEIEDTGHGIPEEKMGQIFNPFYTTKEPGKGTGLGLFIVKQVIERNGGRIKVRSKEGVGTTFILEFPAAEKVKV